ncbi:uromodulin-like [Pogoniulus pusillus]|uniref:uromodulin-like n=1 Tax=Pogoniulus pusillus TaxID=488313 RepID=UPI0030B9634C
MACVSSPQPLAHGKDAGGWSSAEPFAIPPPPPFLPPPQWLLKHSRLGSCAILEAASLPGGEGGDAGRGYKAGWQGAREPPEAAASGGAECGLAMGRTLSSLLLLLPALYQAGCAGTKSQLASPQGPGLALRLQRSPGACLPNPCQHQGRCQAVEDSPVCSCKPGFTGAFCQDVLMKLACKDDHMKMMVRKEVFEVLRIPQELVHLKNKACKVSERWEEGELFWAATLTRDNYTACGSVIQQNSSHVSYFNVLESEWGAGMEVISRSLQLKVNFSCIYSYEQVVKLPFALTAVDKLVQFVVREERINISMRLYKSPSYLQPYHLPTAAIPLTDTLYVLLRAEGHHQLKAFQLSAEDCWATPGTAPYQAVQHKLIEKGCPQDKTVSYLNSSGESTAVKFSFQMFRFVGHPQLFLHCRVRLCAPDALQPCAKQCPRRQRKKRAPEDDYDQVVSYGPIHLLPAGAETPARSEQQHLKGPTPWLLSGLILLAVLGLLTRAAAAVGTRWQSGQQRAAPQ